MNLTQYQRETLNTKSDKFYGGKVSRRVFIERVTAVIEATKKLNELKKALFYGREFYGIEPGELEITCNSLQLWNLHSTPQVGVDLLHAIIGKSTEAAELLEAILTPICGVDKPVDHVNILEEIGDGFWYDGIALEALGASFEMVAGMNNAKLRKRFPNKFTEADAINRDLKGERKTLENSAVASG